MSQDNRSHPPQPQSGQQSKHAAAPAPHVNGTAPPASGLPIKVGAQLPPSAATVPKLASDQMLPNNGAANGNSAIAAGISFQGNAVVNSTCVVAGSFVGNISQAEGVQISITVTETGNLRGDVKAHQIVVFGRTEGLLDASAGLVTLHESANVQGHVRYAKLQVNGADLNATLEKSVASGTTASAKHGA